MILCKFSFDTMLLSELIDAVNPSQTTGPTEGVLKGLAYDSRLALNDYIFVAIPGTLENGEAYIGDAIRRGATVVVTEGTLPEQSSVTFVQVPDARKALAQIAAALHRHPSCGLPLVGITGTNGKTTTAYMIDEIYKTTGAVTGRLGTVEHRIGERIIPASRTTPHAPELQAMLDQMIDASCSVGVLEVSSHALVQHRVEEVHFDVAVFTNLSQDHLDYHRTMDAYFEAKSSLFTRLSEGPKAGKASAVINIDDEWGDKMLGCLDDGVARLTYGLQPTADVRAEDVGETLNGSCFTLVVPGGSGVVNLDLLGAHNISNALAAAASCYALGLSVEAIVAGLNALQNVPGRLERIDGAVGPVYVDYAHTPDALERVCRTLRDHTPGRLSVIFGCGGDRDRSKRAPMAEAVARWADQIIVTNDNPRTEDPAQIAADTVVGIGSVAHEILLDRAEAIARGIDQMEPGDTLLVAGKGHENYMEVNHTVIPFDDRDACRTVISANCLGEQQP